MKNQSIRRTLSLFLAVIFLFGTFPAFALTEGDTGQNTPAAHVAGGQNLLTSESLIDWSSQPSESNPASFVVDGNTSAMNCWNTDAMKSGTEVDQAQTPQWLVLDLGEGTHDISAVKVWYQNNKVWAMQYQVQTAATYSKDAREETAWETVASVSREPANSTLPQGVGQDIADTARWNDTITPTSTPELTQTTLQRYVRFYFEKVNTAAPGNNLNILEVELYAPAVADEEAPTAPTAFAAQPTADGAELTWNAATDNVGVTGYQISLNDEKVAVATGLTHTLTDLLTETEYTAKVTALDAAGNESSPTAATFTTLPAPVVTWDVEFHEDFEGEVVDKEVWGSYIAETDKEYATTFQTSTAQNHTEEGARSYLVAQDKETDIDRSTITWTTAEEGVLRGVVSVWYYDTMTPTATSNTIQLARLELAEHGIDLWAGIGVNNMQAANQGFYVSSDGNGKYVKTAIARSEGWHEFKFDCTGGTNMKIYVDGKLAVTYSNIASFDRITLGDAWANGKSYAPGYYDDVSVQADVYVAPVNAKSELDKITALPQPDADDTQISLPPVKAGLTLSVVGSEVEQVVSNDGAILGTNIGAREVTLLLEMKSDEDPADFARKNLTVTIPDHSANLPGAWFPAVGAPNPRPGIVPSVQEWYGYEGTFTLTGESKIIYNDIAGVGLEKVAGNIVSGVEEISGFTLTARNGTSADVGANDIYIESQHEDTYATGAEGYVLVTDNAGLRIYASTYIGCLYGAVSAQQMLCLAEDHVSIPMGVMRDFPAYEVRGFMADIARTPYRMELLEDYSKIMLWYKMNEFHIHMADNRSVKDGSANSHSEDYEGFHRLESKTFPSLAPEVRKSGLANQTATEYYEQVYGNPFYTQEEWKEFQKYSADLGVYILNELDMPGHSLAYNRYSVENPDNIDWLKDENGNTPGTGHAAEKELLDLIGPNKERALRFATELWDEYTKGEDPVFQGDLIHIGADEYWASGDTGTAFLNFAETMRQTAIDNGKSGKVRIWASFIRMKLTDEQVAPLAPNYQIDMWSTGNDSPVARSAQGFEIVNDLDAYMYGNPGRGRRDVVHAEYIFDNWNPTVFGGSNNLLKGDPNLIGGKTILWGDESSEGIIEQDLNQRILRGVAVTSEKTWGGTREEDTFQNYELRANKLAEGPGTRIAMKVDSKSSLVASYDFNNISTDGTKVFDASGNGYDAALTGGTVEEGVLTFDGNTRMETGLKTISYPYTVSFDLKLSQAEINANAATYADANATNDANLLSGYDGRIQPAGFSGNLSADVNYYTRDFKYQIPADQRVSITLVGTYNGTKLYVDGVLKTFLSQTKDAASYPPKYIADIQSSVVLPMEQIGENLHGGMANIKVYNKALTAEQVAGVDIGRVNVAQNTNATSLTLAAGASGDDMNHRSTYAAKAVDGDGFDLRTETSGSGKSEMNSYWYGFRNDAFLMVDLGIGRDVCGVTIQWCAGGVGKDFKIQTSLDGENWTDVKSVKGNPAASTVTVLALDTPITARYVKLQGVAGNAANTYKVQEFQVYETVDKEELKALLETAEENAAERDLSFESAGEDKSAFDALVFARAMAGSPLSTLANVGAAIDGLSALGVTSSDASLRKLTVNGRTVPDFDSEITEYTLTIMPPESMQMPTVAATPTRSGSEVVITGVGELPCTVSVAVTAPDGESVETYTLTLEEGKYRTVGYSFGTYGDENAFYDIDPTTLTHLVYAFGPIYHDEMLNGSLRPGGVPVPEDRPELLGTLALSEAVRNDLAQMAVLKEVNPELKIMLSVGGGTCPGWVKATNTPEARAKFIASCVAAVEEFHLDGLDLDWEFPGHGAAIDHDPNDKANFEALIKEMRMAMGSEKILTIAASSKDFYLTTSCDVPAVIAYLDFVNVMSYTMTTYLTCYHNSALYTSEKFPATGVPLQSCYEVMKYYTDAGIDAEKLNVGSAFFSKIPPAATKSALNLATLQEALGISGITMTYQQLLEKVINNPETKFVRQWDEVAKVPYMTYPDTKGVPQFAITYEDPQSLAYKAQFIQQGNFGGAVVWQLRQDYEYKLQTALNDALNGAGVYTVTFDSQGGSAVGTVSAMPGTTILKPADPNRSGYAFGGWFRDAACTQSWNFERDTVTSALTLYAKWTAVSDGTGATTPPVETTKNPDGSTTKTTTDKKTGETTAVTTYPDGTKLVTVTPKDGRATTAVTLPKGKDSVTITIPTKTPPAATEVPFIVYPDGTREPVRFSVGTKEGMRLTLTGDAVIEFQTSAKAFPDVEAGTWYSDAAVWITSREIFNGMGDGNFAPNQPMSRAMLVTALWRLDGEKTAEGGTAFADVAADAWFANPVAWASQSGLAGGVGGGRFAPDGQITREQMATMLYRYAGTVGMDTATAGDALSAFPDAPGAADWAGDALAWCVANKLIVGTNGLLNPGAVASRAELAAVILRLADLRLS